MPKTSGLSMTSQAYEQIRESILSGRFPANEKLTISDLVRDMKLGLGAVREALSRLNSEGLVTAETNKGYRVASITAEELEDLTRTRVLIECECLANAIANGDLKWESGIVSSMFELSRLPLFDEATPEQMNPEWNAAHRQFHMALVAACNSPWLLRIRQMLFVQSERYRVATLPYDRAKRDLEAEHQAIADATIARDTEAATEAMRNHLQKTRRILIDAGVAQTGGGTKDTAA